MASRYDQIMKAKKFLPFHLDRLTEQMVEKAEKELKETDEIRAPAVEQMRRLVYNDKDLKCSTDDAFLLQFLRARKFDVQRAFNLLQTQFEVKKSYSDVYNENSLDELHKVYDLGAGFCLPYRDEDGCVVVVFQMEKWNPNEISISTAIVTMTILLLYSIEDVATQVNGVRILVNCKGASFRQLRAITPRYIHLFSKALRNCLPVRFKGIHIYNENMIFQYIWSILKLFLTEKIKGRVHFHGDNQKNLHKFIPKAILTAEYGGDNINFDAVEWCRKEVACHHEKFQALLASGYDC